MAMNFPGRGVKKDVSPQSKCLHWSHRQKNENKCTSRHTVVKIQNGRENEKILNATRREDGLPTKKQPSRWKQASHGWKDAADSGEIASKRHGDSNENCVWSKMNAALTAVGHEGRYFSEKKNEPRRKEYETRSMISEESNKMYW